MNGMVNRRGGHSSSLHISPGSPRTQQAVVGQLHLPRLVEQYVAGFHVPMGGAQGMERIDGPCELERHVEDETDGVQLPATDPVPQ